MRRKTVILRKHKTNKTKKIIYMYIYIYIYIEQKTMRRTI